MILDIETTGLSSKFTEVILVGFIYHKNDRWNITQIFCDHRSEERELLLTLKEYIEPRHLLITYNGHAFDLPYLNTRYAHHQIDFELSMAKHFDLYRVVRASKKALKLDNYKLKTIEEFLDIYRDDQISGKESVELYNLYELEPSKALRNKILLHNYDDIKFMIPTLDILNHIPEEICDRFYPFSYQSKKNKECILISYELLKDYIEVTYSTEEMANLADFRDNFSYAHNDHIAMIKMPVFRIESRVFIDVDLLPFFDIMFNNLAINEQLSLEILNKKNGFQTIIRLLDQHYS